MRHLIYLDPGDKDYKEDLLSKVIDNAICGQISVVPTWEQSASSILNSNSNNVLFLFGEDFLKEDNNLALVESINAMTTIAQLSQGQKRLLFGVVINKRPNKDTINRFKKSNINGIVPNIEIFGNADFYEAVESLLHGLAHWPDSYIESKPKPTNNHSKDGIRLTNRQHEIMLLVSNRGLSNKKIAQVLSISESTVKVHISSILKAYGVRNRTQLALAANQGFTA